MDRTNVYAGRLGLAMIVGSFLFCASGAARLVHLVGGGGGSDLAWIAAILMTGGSAVAGVCSLVLRRREKRAMKD